MVALAKSLVCEQIGRREVVVLFDGHGRMLVDPGRREVVVLFDGHGRMLVDSGRREVVVVFDGHGRMLADSERRILHCCLRFQHLPA
ncbi:hypothetical protein Tco_0706473 [Tanacetum coccineum]|uniref:NHL repeat-containing protein n=1 Tax=Tanacetum coccineum TaxID=301880 RepID=A0ABQ4Y9R4_9ASTR